MLVLSLSEYAELDRKGVGLCLFCHSLNSVCDAPCEECGSRNVIPLEQALLEEKMILEE